MQVEAGLYNYTRNEGFTTRFPMTDEQVQKVLSKGEVMVDHCSLIDIGGEVGMTVESFNEAVKQLSDAKMSATDLKELGKVYYLEEILERYPDNAFTIIDFDEETKNWSSSNIHSDSDKGRLLYELGYASFPVEVPEGLEDYMDYEILWRDTSVNMNIRETSNYLIF